MDDEEFYDLEQIKLIINHWFNDEKKREDLEDLAEYITSNLDDIVVDSATFNR